MQPHTKGFIRRKVSPRFPELVESVCRVCGGTMLSTQKGELTQKEKKHALS
jgi:hypothetical protein